MLWIPVYGLYEAEHHRLAVRVSRAPEARAGGGDLGRPRGVTRRRALPALVWYPGRGRRVLCWSSPWPARATAQRAGGRRGAGRAAGRAAPQRPGAQGVPPKNPMRTAEDSARARQGFPQDVPLVRWAPADSIGLELMGRKGYQLVRYKADEVVFGASDKSITLIRSGPERAAVQRDPDALVADTITYSDTATTVRACGDSIVLHDPSRSDDVNASNCMSYDMAAQGREGLQHRDVGRRAAPPGTSPRTRPRSRATRRRRRATPSRRSTAPSRAATTRSRTTTSGATEIKRIGGNVDGRAAGHPVHPGHPGDVVPVHLPGRAGRDATRESSRRSSASPSCCATAPTTGGRSTTPATISR